MIGHLGDGKLSRGRVCVNYYTVKKAYYKLSLPFHPHNAGNKFRAARKFQALGKIYDILSDDSKRRLYNREGSIIAVLSSDSVISV